MKITSHNYKSLNYNENHELFVGTHTGSFKRIQLNNPDNPYKTINLQNISVLNKDSRITCLNWGDNKQNEILIGRANKFVKIFDSKSDEFTSNLEMVDAPIVGLARYDGILIAGIGNGKVQILQDSPEPTIIDVGNHLSKIRQCNEDKKLIATGGKDLKNRLKIWDVSTKENIFTTKNLPNDSLQLEVPVWDNDFNFIDKNCLGSCSRYGYIRVYDTRKQRRPVVKYASKEQISFSCMTIFGNLIFVGTTTGGMRAFDIRNLRNQVHTYKGFTGSVIDLDIDSTGKYLCSTSLDRYARVHDANKTELLYQNYIKSKGTAILLKENVEVPLINASLNDTSDDCVIVNEESANNSENDSEFDDMFDNMEQVDDDDEDVQEEGDDKEDDDDEDDSVAEEEEVNEPPKSKKLKLK